MAQASAQLNAALQPCSHVGVVKYANVLWPYMKCNNAYKHSYLLTYSIVFLGDVLSKLLNILCRFVYVVVLI